MSRSPIPDVSAAVAYAAGLQCPPKVVDGYVHVSTACRRCGGSGNTGHFQDGGVCYGCNGAYTANNYARIPVLDWSRWHLQQQKQQVKRAQARRERAAALEAAKLEGQRAYNERQGHGRLTFEELREKQRAELQPITEGRYEITGTVLSVKPYTSDFGRFARVSYKMTVRVDGCGNSVWGTCPSSLDFVEYVKHYEATADYPAADVTEQRALRRGDRVRFVATVQRSDRDPAFGVFSRPAKAVVLDPQENPELVGV